MSVIDTLITDRTESDVTRLSKLSAIGWERMTESERAEWLTSKGSYNYTDLNRVTEALEYLNNRLTSYGYNPGYTPISLPHGVWTNADIPNESQMNQYLSNVEKIRKVLEVPPETPETPETMRKLTASEANDIEKILSVVETVINQVVSGFNRSNAPYFWSGNRPLPTSYSDRGRNWAELDAMHTTWRNWQVANWYLLLYGNLKAEGAVT